MRFLFEPSVGRSLTSPKPVASEGAGRALILPQRVCPERWREGVAARSSACIMGLVEGSELAYVGLGANVGAPRDQLSHAVAALGALPGVAIDGVSPLYRSRPVGPVAQSDFLNAVVGLEVPAGPDPAHAAMALLIALKSIERAMGRQDRERWGPREIDLDLLLFGAHVLRLEREAWARSDDPMRTGAQWLEVPHPAAGDRLFVLAPLADLAPRLEPPGWRMNVAMARDRALEAEGTDAARVIAVWEEGAGAWIDAAPDASTG